MSLRVKCIILVSDWDAKTPVGQTSTEFIVEEDNIGIGRDTVMFVAADTFMKAVAGTGRSGMYMTQPGVQQTLRHDKVDSAMMDRHRAIGALYSQIHDAAKRIYEETRPKTPPPAQTEPAKTGKGRTR